MSLIFILATLCIAIYGYCALKLWLAIANKSNPESADNLDLENTSNRNFVQLLIILAIVIHGYLLYQSVFSNDGASISFGLAISMAGWISVVIYLLISLITKTVNLGIIVLPIGLLAVIAGAISFENSYYIEQISKDVGIHIAIAVPTFGILCVAFAQAILLVAHDKQLNNPISALPALPAIQTMDSNLFWLTLTGFLLMTLNLAVGMVSNHNSQGNILEFNHHIFLSVIAWVGFGCLILGRKIYGWRGEIAAKWTIIAFCFLMLAYFGTRFVNDVILVG